ARTCAVRRAPDSSRRRPSRLLCSWSTALLAGAGLLVAVAPDARAQWTVYDPANYAENALQYVHQLTQIKYQLQQIQYQLQALSKLQNAPWRDVRSPLAGIASVMGG